MNEDTSLLKTKKKKLEVDSAKDITHTHVRTYGDIEEKKKRAEATHKHTNIARKVDGRKKEKRLESSGLGIANRSPCVLKGFQMC